MASAAKATRTRYGQIARRSRLKSGLHNLCITGLMLLPGLALSAEPAPQVPTGPAASADKLPWVGRWENNTGGNLMGLLLKDGEHCEIYVERAFAQRSTRACRYEPFEDRYVLFLFNEQGVCGDNPDFEFLFFADIPAVHLVTRTMDIVMQSVTP